MHSWVIKNADSVNLLCWFNLAKNAVFAYSIMLSRFLTAVHVNSCELPESSANHFDDINLSCAIINNPTYNYILTKFSLQKYC